jgi:hypothetical protein
MEYLKIRCRCKQKNTPLECRSVLGGPSLETLYNHNFEVSPFIEVRYCRECHKMSRITIKNLHEIPLIEALEKEEKISFVEPEAIFGFVEVHR